MIDDFSYLFCSAATTSDVLSGSISPGHRDICFSGQHNIQLGYPRDLGYVLWTWKSCVSRQTDGGAFTVCWMHRWNAAFKQI